MTRGTSKTDKNVAHWIQIGRVRLGWWRKIVGFRIVTRHSMFWWPRGSFSITIGHFAIARFNSELIEARP